MRCMQVGTTKKGEMKSKLLVQRPPCLIIKSCKNIDNHIMILSYSPSPKTYVACMYFAATTSYSFVGTTINNTRIRNK
jgi:hypothetical protein